MAKKLFRVFRACHGEVADEDGYFVVNSLLSADVLNSLLHSCFAEMIIHFEKNDEDSLREYEALRRNVKERSREGSLSVKMAT